MPKVQCPYCQSYLKVPESILGKRIRCKNESCKQTFLAQEEQDIPIEPESIAPEEFNFPPPQYDQKESRPRFAGSGNGLFGQGKSTGKAPSNPNEKYPNLRKYLELLAIIYHVSLYVGCVAIGLFAVISLGLSLMVGGSSLVEFAGRIFILLLLSVAALLVLYLFYVMSMAGIEFIHVIMDIEQNTRLKDQSQDKSDHDLPLLDNLES